MDSRTLITLPRNGKPIEAAEFLGVDEQTLNKWRFQKIGPPYVRVSARCIRYPMDKLAAWAESRVVKPINA